MPGKIVRKLAEEGPVRTPELKRALLSCRSQFFSVRIDPDSCHAIFVGDPRSEQMRVRTPQPNGMICDAANCDYFPVVAEGDVRYLIIIQRLCSDRPIRFRDGSLELW